jgi:hypothetical protein
MSTAENAGFRPFKLLRPSAFWDVMGRGLLVAYRTHIFKGEAVLQERRP